MINSVKKLIMISRPLSWPNTAYPFAAGYLMTGGRFDAVLVVATLYFIFPYNLLMYGVNDVFDYESDIRNPRKGGVEGMREQREFHPIIIAASLFTNLPFLAWLLITQGSWAAWALGGLIFTVLAYSVPGLRFKERPIIDSLTSSSHFVGPLIYALALSGFPVQAWPFVAAFFLWGMASHAFGAVQDIVPDRRGGIESIATVFGAQSTVRLSIGLYLTAATIVVYQGFPAAVVGLAGLLYVINIFGYRHLSDKLSERANRGWQRFLGLNYFTGFVVTLVLMYQTMAN